MEDRAGGEQRFCRAEDVLDHPPFAISQHGLQWGERGIGAQHIGAVEHGIEGDAARVDLKAAAGGELEEAAIAAIAHKALVATVQGGFEGSEDGVTRGLVLLRLGASASLRQTM